MKLAGIKCPGCKLLWGAIVVDWFTAGALRAEDDLDQQLLESLEGSRTPDSPVTVVNRLLDNTESARERLAAGQPTTTHPSNNRFWTTSTHSSNKPGSRLPRGVLLRLRAIRRRSRMGERGLRSPGLSRRSSPPEILPRSEMAGRETIPTRPPGIGRANDARGRNGDRTGTAAGTGDGRLGTSSAKSPGTDAKCL